MKKLICILTSIVLCLSCFGLFGCINNNNGNDEPKYNIVFLGDSIAEGILGVSPISEKNDYSYCGIIGQINNFSYHNRAVSGYQTFQMLDYISQDEDQSAYAHITLIKNADIISISMFGNDYIYTGLGTLMREAVAGKSDVRDEVLERVKTNIHLIVTRLRELNPTATILWQTLYNPVFEGSPILAQSTYDYLKNYYGIEGDDIYKWGDFILEKLNQLLFDYVEEYPNAIIIPDVYKSFKDLYNIDHDYIKRLIYKDGIHPSNEGHAVIASTIQATLEEFGFADSRSLSNYKKLCSERLDRMFIDTDVNITKTKTEINKASDFNQVNNAYFNNTVNIIPNYIRPQNQLTSTEGKKLVEEDMVFDLSSLNIDGGPVDGLPINMIIDKNRTKIKLGKDGMLTFDIYINELIYNVAKEALENMDASTFDISAAEKYIMEMFPGNSFKTLEKFFGAVNEILGVKINGFDFEKDNIKAIAESLASTGKLPQEVELPEEISFTITQPYQLVHIDSKTNEDGYTAVYVGNYRGSEPYIIMTLTENDLGINTLTVINEFIFLTVEFINYSDIEE